MYCKNCGKPFTEGAKFCTGCGEKIEEVSIKVTTKKKSKKPMVEAKDEETYVYEAQAIIDNERKCHTV